MTTVELERVRRLPPAERLELIGQLWDSLVDDDVDPQLSAAQRVELDRRLDRIEHSPSAGVSWPEARRRIERGEAHS